jgi:large subunit ribosomal protein L28
VQPRAPIALPAKTPWFERFLEQVERFSESPPKALNPAARNTKVWSEVMAQVCDICGKGPQFGNNISHAHNVTRRRWNVNLQAVKALVNGAAKRIRVCTSCIKAGKIAKA